jgi:glutamyl-tRNA synthetase
MNQIELKEMADLLLPDVKHSAEEVHHLYPERKTSHEAQVTRFAPSPTGFLHVGGLYSALVSSRVAKQSNGVFILRIEDTDKKREVENGTRDIVLALSRFGIKFDEGIGMDETQHGEYGPYKQSERKEIYQVFAKVLLKKGLAYPCFCSEEELEQIRKEQEANGQRPGYYGTYAKYRNVSLEEVREKLSTGCSFVLRLKSPGDPEKVGSIEDAIKGQIQIPENDQDIVILKSDGIPTYHFAHVVDDHLMRVTTVIRGDEWLSSLPIHLQLFSLLGWEPPKYAHISTIQKEENGAKRKLSKRKDPEASVSYYHQNGIPSEGLTEYLLNIANSNFEDWRRENPEKSNEDFTLELKKMSVSGALFDMVKLTNICKNLIGNLQGKIVYETSLEWAREYDEELAYFMERNSVYTLNILNIERGGEKPRKDIAKWSDIKAYLTYFSDEWFHEEIDSTGFSFSDKISREEIRALLKDYLEAYDSKDDKDVWFGKVKELAEQYGFSKDVKTYKKSPDTFKGHVGDVAEIIRVALTNRKNTPDLAQIMVVMGIERIKRRFEMV